MSLTSTFGIYLKNKTQIRAYGIYIVSFRCSPGDVRRQVPVRLVQEDLHALRRLLLQQPRLRPVQVLRLNATPNEPDTTTQQELFFTFTYHLTMHVRTC